MEHEHVQHVAAPSDRVYRALAEPEGLARFVPQLTAVHRTQGDRVEVEARYGGQTQRGEAWLRRDDEQRRIEWGGEGSDYHGSLAVEPDGEGSRLTLRLTTQRAADADPDVAGTLDAIRRLLEAEL
jgi:carbon monoxide dehydrogenase subunit G